MAPPSSPSPPYAPPPSPPPSPPLPPPSPPAACPTCYPWASGEGRTCNEWALNAPHAEPRDTCLLLEDQYGCDCTGCTCLDHMPPPPSPAPPPIRPPLHPFPHAPPPAAPVVTLDAMAMVLLCFVIALICAGCVSVCSCYLGWVDPPGAPRTRACAQPPAELSRSAVEPQPSAPLTARARRLAGPDAHRPVKDFKRLMVFLKLRTVEVAAEAKEKARRVSLRLSSAGGDGGGGALPVPGQATAGDGSSPGTPLAALPVQQAVQDTTSSSASHLSPSSPGKAELAQRA